MPVKCRREFSHRAAAVGNEHLRHVDIEFSLCDKRDRAARHRFRGKLVPVVLLAAKTHEQVSLHDVLAVRADPPDLGISAARQFFCSDLFR